VGERAKIFVAGVCAGVLERRGPDYVFAYEPTYPAAAPPVSLLMPPTTKDYKSVGRVHPFFEGLMYEGWLRRLAEGVGSESEAPAGVIDYLVKKCSHSIGDVEIAAEDAFRPAEMRPITVTRSGFSPGLVRRDRCLLCLQRLPSKGHNRSYHEACSLSFFGTEEPPLFPFGSGDFERLAIDSISSGIAIPGVQPKLPVYYPEGDSHFILKPHVQGVQAAPEIEHLWMKLFTLLGVQTAASGLVETESGELVYLTRRFDRARGGGKLHFEDFAQLHQKSSLGNEKFEGRVSDIAKTIKAYASPRPRARDLERLIELTVLNLVFGHSDAHLKNHAIIGTSGDGRTPLYTLSPAYDILPNQFLGKPSANASALFINHKKRHILVADLKQEAEDSGVKAQRVDEVLARVVERGADIVALMRQSFVPQGKVDQLKMLIDKRLRSLGTPPLPEEGI